MDWINSKRISAWGEETTAKSKLPLLVSKLVRATAPVDTFPEFPTGEQTYLGGWDGVVRSSAASAYLPAGISLWEMSTEKKAITAKANRDYQKRKKNPLGYSPAECVYIFVTTHRWSQKDKWVASKKAENIWKDVIAYDAINLEEWLRNAPAVGWWLAVESANMPSDGILSVEQSWQDYAESTNFKLATQVLTCSRASEASLVRSFLTGPHARLTIKARSRTEAVAFILASGMEQDTQQREDFLSKTLIISNPQSFRTLANNRHGLTLIANFEDTESLDGAVSKGHHVLLPLGADDSHGAGTPLTLPQIGSELEKALIESGLSSEEARKFTVESGRDLTILRRLMKFSYIKIKWAAPEFASMLLPALFLGRWDETKEGDTDIIEALAGEPYATYIEKLNRWHSDPHPFLYQIGSCWRLASPLDAWNVLAVHITIPQLERFESTALSVLGQVKPLFDLAPEKRFMASLYGKESIYSSWARGGVSQSLILFALFGTSLQLSVGNSQEWVNEVVGRLLQSRESELWSSLNDVLPLVAEAAPERFLSDTYTALVRNPETIMGMFQEDPSPLFPRGHYTGLLWALEALAWFPAYLQTASQILARLAAMDPGGRLGNRPINSLRAIYLPWKPQTFANPYERNKHLTELGQHDSQLAWSLVEILLPQPHQNAFPTYKTRWREYGVENSNRPLTYGEIWETNAMVLEIAIPLAGTDEKRLAVLVQDAATMMHKDRERLFSHLTAIAGEVPQHDYCVLAALRGTLRHHRSYPDQPWALPEDELGEYDRLLPLFEPKSATEICRQLFEERHPFLPEMAAIPAHDYHGEQNFIRDKRIEATLAVYTAQGLDGIIELAKSMREKYYFGETLAYVLKAPDDQQRIILELGIDCPDDSSPGAGLIWRAAEIHGWDWAEQTYQTLKAHGTSHPDLARFLKWVVLTSELYQFVETQEEDIVTEYWAKNRPWLVQLSDAEKVGSIEHLLLVGRSADAVHLIHLFDAPCPTELIVRALTAAAQTVAGHGPSSNDVQTLLDVLYHRRDYERTQMAKVEWLCLRFTSAIDKSPYTRILQEEIAASPDFFEYILELLYKPEGEDNNQELTAEEHQEKVFSSTMAYYLLNDWHLIPGTDDKGEISDEALTAWIDKARTLAAENLRSKPADLYIGRVLAHYPGPIRKGVPPDAVCRQIDRIDTLEIRSGFHTEIFNQHESPLRGSTNGKSDEWVLAAHYQGVADALLLKWPVTASIFESVAKDHRGGAIWFDQELQKTSLEY